MKRRILSVLIALAMCVAILPAAALADDTPYILAIGDTITSGYGLEDAETQSYPAILADTLGMDVRYHVAEVMPTETLYTDLLAGTYDADIEGASIITLLVGGDDMLPVIYNYLTSAYNAACGTSYTKDEIQAVLMDLSSNYAIALSLLTLASDETVLAGLLDALTDAIGTFQANLTGIVAYLRSENPEATIVVATLYNPYQWLSDSYGSISDTIASGVAVMSTAVAAGAADGSYVFADIASAFAASEETLTNASIAAMSLDPHPNAAGQAVIAQTILTALAGETAATPFTDIADSQFAEAIAAVYAAGLMNGVSESTFNPDGDLTRAMVYTIIYRAMGEPAFTGTVSYTDVAEGMWYTDAVLWAAEMGLATGYTDGTFQPNTAVTREQLATILYRYATALGADTSTAASLDDYTDGSAVQEYAVAAVQWAVANGILVCRADGMLNPGEAATRAEVAQALYVLIEQSGSE